MTTDLGQQFLLLEKRQFAMKEHISVLHQIRKDFESSASWSRFFGMSAVILNATLIPLNAIINAFNIKAAKGLYQKIVYYLYDEFGKSGTQNESYVTNLFAMAKSIIVSYLSKERLTDYIPGVNIILGFVEDTITLFKTVSDYNEGMQELQLIRQNLDRNLHRAIQELTNIGIKLGQIFDRAEVYTRTA